MQKKLLYLLLLINYAYSQEKSEFSVVLDRVRKVCIETPKNAKEDVYLLKKIAKDSLEIAQSIQYLSYFHDFTGNNDSARYYYQKRLNYTKENFPTSNNYYQAVIDYVNWGMSYVDSNILMNELTEALLIIDEEKNTQQKGLLYLLMGDVLKYQKRYDKAGEYYDKSFKLIKGKYVAVDYFYRKGEIQIIKGDYEKAKEELLKGISALDDDKNNNGYPLLLNKLGYVYLFLGDLENSSQSLYESLYYQKENGFNWMSTETYLYLSTLAKFKKDSRLEKFNLDKALEINQGNIYNLKDIHLSYKDYFSRKGDYINENYHLTKFNQINDSIFNIEKAKLGSDMEYRFRLRESKKEIELKEKIIQKETRIKTILIIGWLLLFLLSTALIIVYYKKNKAQKKLRNNQKLLHEEQLKLMLENQRTEIIKEKIKAKLEEREKLSLELHDGIANEIGALKVSLTNDYNFDKKNINAIVNKIDYLYHEVRNLSHDLNPDKIADVELSQLIYNLCEIAEKKGIKTHKNILLSKKIDLLEDSILINIYRVLQEAINNVIKHAMASEIHLNVIESEKELLVIIKDNGIGFQKTGSKSSGIGLSNIRKRVEALNGIIEIQSTSEGVKLEIKIPT